jgi:butyryl-CoA dehydrogenase
MDFELTPEQEAFRRDAEQFAREHVAPLAAEIDATDAFPAALVRLAGQRGFLGVTVPRAWGGQERDYVSFALAIEAIAHTSATVAVILAVNNSLVAETVSAFGTAAQKEQWLRALASGDALGAFALSEQQAGTDAANLEMRAEPVGDGGFVLNGTKTWVANAEAAAVALVFAATRPGERGRGITAFLVPLDTAGITRAGRADSLGVRGLGCLDLEFHDVHVAADQQVGPANGGFGMARWALEGGRIAIAAQALGVGRAALDQALRHAKTRQTFGRPIASYQAVQWMLADIATDLEAARILTWRAASAKDTQEHCALEAATAKLVASEAAHRAADKAMQILASAGYRRGSKVERLFRDARATEIYQGTSETQRMVIADHILGLRRHA